MRIGSIVPDTFGRRALCLFAASAGALAPAAWARDWPVSDRAEVRRTFVVRGKPAPRIAVDNVNGSIEVIGENRRDVEMVAIRTTGARSSEKLARANDEVELVIDTDSSTVDLYVDGPFRCDDGCRDRDRRRRRNSDDDYNVSFEFTLRVPRQSDLELGTVNGGDVVVRGVVGSIEVGNVNGGIEAVEIGGSSRLKTVNGGVSATFVTPPLDSCFFASINGDLDVAFPDDLAADVRAKTFNGEIYSAFDSTPLPPRKTIAESEGRGTKYRIGTPGFRIGSGGPVLEFDAFNGDVRIRRR